MVHETIKQDVRYLNRYRVVHEVFLSLSAAFTITILSCIYVVTGLSNVDSKNFDWWYLILRATVRINLFFHQLPHGLGFSAGFFDLVLGLALLFFLALSAVARTSFGRAVLDPVAGIFLFGIFPSAALAGVVTGSAAAQEHSFWFEVLGLLLIPMLVGSVYLSRNWIFPKWTGLLLLAIYYGFFAWLYYGRYSWIIWSNHAVFYLGLAFLVVGPCAGIAWMLYARTSRQTPPTAVLGSVKWRRFVYGLPLWVMLVIPWLPARNYIVAHPKDLSSLTISLVRGKCLGSCPVYTITIHGTGLVDYRGQRFVRVTGPETETLTASKVASLLQSFDREKFFTLEDRAFANCFDTPYSTITISVDGKTKAVSGDGCYSTNGPKASLMKLAQEIDDVADSKKWVYCPSYAECLGR
jgi:hypothetical protein